MGRMHSKGKGMSSSALPYKRSAPSWLKMTTPEVPASTCSRSLYTGADGTCSWYQLGALVLDTAASADVLATCRSLTR